jgi:hypothetical protein
MSKLCVWVKKQEQGEEARAGWKKSKLGKANGRGEMERSEQRQSKGANGRSEGPQLKPQSISTRLRDAASQDRVIFICTVDRT